AAGPRTDVTNTIGKDLFGSNLDAKHRVRLTLDGRTIELLSFGKELVHLTRDEKLVERALDRESMEQDWKAICATGNRWRGTLFNPQVDQTVEVELEITSGVNELGNVEAELSLAKEKRAKILFRGVLKTDDRNV